MPEKQETALALLGGQSDGIELLTEKFEKMLDIGQLLVNSQLTPSGVRTREAALAIVLAGRELGMGVMASLRSFHVVEGKPVMEASAQLARAISAGVVCEWKKTDDKEAVLKLSRNGISYESKWTFAMAERAGLTKETRNGKQSNWVKSPEAMLRARAVTAGIRAFCPDVLGGGALYTAEELERDEPTERREETPRKPYGATLEGGKEAIDAEYTDASRKEVSPEERLADLGITIPMFDAWRKSESTDEKPKGPWSTLDAGQQAMIAHKLSVPEDVVRKRYDAFVLAYREFSAKEEEAAKNAEASKAETEGLLPNGHHQQFTEKVRKRLNVELGKLTPPLKYDDYARFHEAHERGRPSAWNEQKQWEMLKHCQEGGWEEIVEWIGKNPKEEGK